MGNRLTVYVNKRGTWKIREVGKFGLKTDVCNLPVFCFYLECLLDRSHEAEVLQLHWKYVAAP